MEWNRKIDRRMNPSTFQDRFVSLNCFGRLFVAVYCCCIPCGVYHTCMCTAADAVGSTTVAATIKTDVVSAEVCQMETFQAECAADEVIWIETAQLGRLQIGRCVTETSRMYPIGCTLDVQPEMESFCSGRRRCSVRIDDVSFTRTAPCHRDLKDHLWVGYRCVKVVVPATNCRNRQSSHALTAPLSGYIASQTTEDTGCGLTDTPLILQASPGQRINITMYDFAHDAVMTIRRGSQSSSAGSSDSASGYPRTCRVYATIREPSRGTTSTVCGLQGRVLNVFTSDAERVELRFMTVARPGQSGATSSGGAGAPAAGAAAGSAAAAAGGGAGSAAGKQAAGSSSDAYFVFHFTFLGCADPPIADDGKTWKRRTLDTLTIGCSGAEPHTWQLTCVGNEWKGTYANCTAVYGDSNIPMLAYPFAMSTVVVVIIAVFVSFFIVLVGIICIKWRMKSDSERRLRLRQTDPDQYDGAPYAHGDKSTIEASYSVGSVAGQQDPAAAAVAAANAGIRNEYARMRLQRLGHFRPVPPYGFSDAGGSVSYGVPCRGGPYGGVEHIYESPDAIRRGDNFSTGGGGADAGCHYTPTMVGDLEDPGAVDAGGERYLPPGRWPVTAMQRQQSQQQQQQQLQQQVSCGGMPLQQVQCRVSTPKAKNAGNYSL